MKPQEWSRAFEQIYHRKPTQIEFKDAKRNGFPEVPPIEDVTTEMTATRFKDKISQSFSNLNKESLKFDPKVLKRKDNVFLLIGLGIFLSFVLAGTLILYGWAKENEEREMRIEEATLRVESEAQLDEMMASFEESETKEEKVDKTVNNDPLKGKWDDTKKQALATEMVKFGNMMNQVGYRDITNEFSGKISMVDDTNGNSPIDAELSSDGSGSSEYRCLAVYLYQNGATLHRYFFSIRTDGSSVVLYSSDPVGTQDYKVHVTENSDLFNAWRNVIG